MIRVKVIINVHYIIYKQAGVFLLLVTRLSRKSLIHVTIHVGTCNIFTFTLQFLEGEDHYSILTKLRPFTFKC